MNFASIKEIEQSIADAQLTQFSDESLEHLVNGQLDAGSSAWCGVTHGGSNCC